MSLCECGCGAKVKNRFVHNHHLYKPLLGRFWEKVSKTSGCWIWMGAKDPNGYGRFNIKGKAVLAHRASFIFSGKDPGDLFVCHSCDNPSCVRPTHLFLGTNEDNMRDCSIKGRCHRGEENGMSLLTQDQVLEIKHLLETRELNREAIASRFSVSKATIYDIEAGRTWGWLK